MPDSASDSGRAERGVPLFSVAIATYNRAGLLRACIESVLAQTWPDFEVVVVDGASTDNSVAVVRSIADRRVRLVVQPANVGISAGRWEAVTQSRATWVVQLDSDHTLLPEALATFAAAIDVLDDPAIGAVGAKYRWDTGRVTPSFVPAGPVDYEARMRWVEQEGGTDCLFCARRSALLETNWFKDRRASMDALFHLNFSRRWRQVYLDRELARQVTTVEESSSRAHKGRAKMLRKWAPDMAWQYEEIQRLHGSALRAHGPRSYRGMVRQASLHSFYAGARRRGLMQGARYLRLAPGDVGFWLVLVAGAVSPSLVGRLNEWRHAVRNTAGL